MGFGIRVAHALFEQRLAKITWLTPNRFEESLVVWAILVLILFELLGQDEYWALTIEFVPQNLNLLLRVEAELL